MENSASIQAIRPVFNILKLTFGLVPIVAGLDKFTNLLTDWKQYLHPGMAEALPFSPEIFMMVVGVIEIIAGIAVLWKPALGGMVVAAWLLLIAATLLLSGKFFDVAVRDIVMAIAAFCMAKMAKLV